MEFIKKKSLKLFFIVVICLSVVCEYLIVNNNIQIIYLILMWIPAFAALISTIYEVVTKDNMSSFIDFIHNLGFKVCNIKYILISVVLPLIYLLIPYIIYWIMYPDNFAYTGVSINLIIKDCVPTLFIGVFFSLLSALGEEIGWRGYLVPSLSVVYGKKRALIISSLFWCVWHFPLIMGGAYLSDLPLLYQLIAFVLCIFPVGVLCGLLSLKTQSVWPSAFLHAAHNNYDQSVFQIITRGNNMFYFVSETGVYTIVLLWILMLFYSLLKKKQV